MVSGRSSMLCADERTTPEVRRFAIRWLVAALAVLVAAAGVRLLADRAEQDARARADALSTVASSVTALRLSLHLTADERTATPGRTVESAELTRDIARSRAALAAARGAGVTVPDLPPLVARVADWQHGRPVAGGAPRGVHRRSPESLLDGTAGTLESDLVVSARRLAERVPAARARANDAAARARLLGLLATLLGLGVAVAGGALILRKAWLLARSADTRREREARWSAQIEAVLAWSSRAKAATTRSQLIGFARTTPHEAVGAACFTVAEGGPPAHVSHGLPRLVLEVDGAGEGLHVAVCFEEGRGDELDHHALSLLLGHLAALWRTVLRQEELERAAGHDALTGLPNRRSFEAELERRVALSRRRGLPFTVALVDLDHFKSVNDCLGHPEGDTVLRRAGQAVRASLRSSDRVFRLGGEEFALILETADEGGVAELLERAREAVKALAVEPFEGRLLSASIGWAVFPSDAGDGAELVERADAALYVAKNAGRDRVLRSEPQAA